MIQFDVVKIRMQEDVAGKCTVTIFFHYVDTPFIPNVLVIENVTADVPIDLTAFSDWPEGATFT